MIKSVAFFKECTCNSTFCITYLKARELLFVDEDVTAELDDDSCWCCFNCWLLAVVNKLLLILLMLLFVDDSWLRCKGRVFRWWSGRVEEDWGVEEEYRVTWWGPEPAPQSFELRVVEIVIFVVEGLVSCCCGEGLAVRPAGAGLTCHLGTWKKLFEYF